MWLFRIQLQHLIVGQHLIQLCIGLSILRSHMTIYIFGKEVMFSAAFVCLYVCQCLSVGNITQKVMNGL